MAKPSSRRPHKQLLFMWVRQELKNTSRAETGLDVACGYMQFLPLFRTKKYIGVDIDEDRITCAKERYPQATGIVSSIEDMDSSVKGDFVACIQAIGINQFFNSQNTLLCVRKLIEATNKNGTLMFNIGPLSTRYSEEIEAELRTSFVSVEIRSYGAFSSRLPSILSKLLAMAMWLVPALRKAKDQEVRYFYLCKGRTEA